MAKLKNNNHAIADIRLADWGRKEINWAEVEMPGLMALRSKYIPNLQTKRTSC